MQLQQTKDVVVVGGPNGAGKTTWATRYLAKTLDVHQFVNADEIARGLSPLDPDTSVLAAGRLMIDRLDELAKTGESFAFETTCASRRHSTFLKKCRSLSYRITLIYLWLPSADFAVARVLQRVREGGHRIPNDVIVRRYATGLRNMRHLYLPLADIAHIYDNADQQGTPIMSYVASGAFIIHDSARWSQIEEATR